MATTTAEERAAAANMRSCSNGIGDSSSVDSNLFPSVEIEVSLSLPVCTRTKILARYEDLVCLKKMQFMS